MGLKEKRKRETKEEVCRRKNWGEQSSDKEYRKIGALSNRGIRQLRHPGQAQDETRRGCSEGESTTADSDFAGAFDIPIVACGSRFLNAVSSSAAFEVWTRLRVEAREKKKKRGKEKSRCLETGSRGRPDAALTRGCAGLAPLKAIANAVRAARKDAGLAFPGCRGGG